MGQDPGSFHGMLTEEGPKTYLLDRGHPMEDSWKAKLRLLGFEDDPFPDTMIRRLDEIEFTAVYHPFKSIAFFASHVGTRSAAFGEFFVGKECSAGQIATTLEHVYARNYPDKPSIRLFVPAAARTSPLP
jgi:hypothetical protein